MIEVRAWVNQPPCPACSGHGIAVYHGGDPCPKETLAIKKTCHNDGWNIFSAASCDHCLRKALMPGAGWSEDKLAKALTSWDERGVIPGSHDEWPLASKKQRERVEAMAKAMRFALGEER